MDKNISRALYGNKQDIICSSHEDFLVEKSREDNLHRNFTIFHPSAFGGCLRQMAYQYHGETNEKYREKKDITPYFVRVCDNGNAFHDRMQKILSVQGILRGWWKCRRCGEITGPEFEKEGSVIGIFCPEKCKCIKSNCIDKRRKYDLFDYEEISLKSDPKYNFAGHCDGIVELETGNPDSRWVIDFKSIKTEKFAFLKEPDEKYKTQIMIYMWLTGVHKSFLYYENKNDHTIAEIPIRYNQSVIDDIKERSAKLFQIVKAGQIPTKNKTYKKTTAPCRWCYYKDEFCY